MLLCLGAMGLAAQTDPGVATNIRGETINKLPNLNNVRPLNQLPTLDKLVPTIPEIHAHSLISEANKRGLASRPAGPSGVASVGEDRAPTQTERELVRRAGQNRVPLGDLAREWKRRKEAEQAAAPNRKRHVLELPEKK